MRIAAICALGAVMFATVALSVLGATLQRAIYNGEPLFAGLAVTLLVLLIVGAIALDRGQRHDQR